MGMARWRPSRMQLRKSRTAVQPGSRRTGQDLIGAIAPCSTQPCTSTAAGPSPPMMPIRWDNAMPRGTIDMKVRPHESIPKMLSMSWACKPPWMHLHVQGPPQSRRHCRLPDSASYTPCAHPTSVHVHRTGKS
jgi:hypothetical protein